MNKSPLIHALGISLFFCSASLPLSAGEQPVVLDSPVLMAPLSPDGAKLDLRYKGQVAKGGRIDLTAANGFFDRCFEALEPQKAAPGDEGLIGTGFGSLGRLSDGVPGTARWHLWCAEAGEIQATFFMQVPAREAGHPWVIRVGDESHTLKAHASDGQPAQEQTLTFTVKQPGKITLAIDCTKTPPAAETRIHSIRLTGSAVAKASLLRTRWRPSAVHTHFFAPDDCPTPNMWVFETKPVTEATSYSPLTTPFGYFGTSFKTGGRVPEGAGFNFSMWIAGRDATQAPPIDQMVRLIGTDLPAAGYSTFGGEGTGVKFRGAVAYPDGGERTIQALRVESQDGLTTFYGYFYDEQAHRWRLYASAQKPRKVGAHTTPKQRAQAAKEGGGGLRSTGSFCEIPGPPNRERSGDLLREIKRRGWFFGSDQKWYRAQLGPGVPGASDDADSAPAPKDADSPASPRGRRRGAADSPSDQRAYYMADYATEGWMAMATGGMEFYTTIAKPPQRGGAPAALPAYLSPEKTAQLFHLPVRFGEANAVQLTCGSAAIDYDIKETGPNAKAILYYGTVDSLTYPPQKVSKGSAVEIDMHRPARTWQSATPEQKVTAGVNRFQLSGLKGSATYYYRLFVTHDQGKSWDYQSGSFQTP